MSEELDSIQLDNVFLDNAEMTVDGKFRVGVAERFMKVLKTICPEHADKLGIIPTMNESLKLVPYPDFMARVEYWKTLNEAVSEQRTIKNLETGLAKLVQLDSQNRIKLTPAQVKFAKVKKEALIVGRISHMELYDPEVFTEQLMKDMKNFSAASDAVARDAAGKNVAPQFVIQAAPVKG